MALYDRFRVYDDNGQEVVKLPIWPTITSFTEILAGEQTDAGVIDRFNLDSGEQAEFAQVKTQIGTNITNLASVECDFLKADADVTTFLALGDGSFNFVVGDIKSSTLSTKFSPSNSISPSKFTTRGSGSTA